jgi:arylsulfatase A-like enzyme
LIDRRTFLLTSAALAAAAELKPNVVLIVARGWRGQATPWAGDPDLVAPNLEKFAREALVIPRAYCCYPRSTPARAALATGRFPHTIGVIKDGATLPPAEVTIDAILKRAGYQTSTDLAGNRTPPFFLRLSLDPPRLGQTYDASMIHPRQNVTSEDTRQVLTHAYGIWRALDTELGRILRAVGAAADTIVVFTSDHGQQLGSHGIDDDDVAYEESVRIPLAIRYPRVLRPGASDLLFSQLDIMPTLLGFCGEPVPEDVQGHDLSALLRGEKSERPESLYAEGRIGQKDEWRMFVLGSDKLVINALGEVTHLFNLADDPYELTNLAHEPAMQLKRDQMAALLRTSMGKAGDFKRRSQPLF